MPLKDPTSSKTRGSLPVAPLVDLLKDRESHEANESRTRRDSGASNDSRFSNPLGAKDVISTNDRRTEILNLKMDVPDTMEARPSTSGKHFPVRGGRNTGNNENLRRQAHVRTLLTWCVLPNIFQVQTWSPQDSVFDHTQSFDDDSSFQEDENYTMVYRGDQAQREQFLPRMNQPQQPYKDSINVTPIDIPPGFLQEKVQMEKEYRQREKEFNHKTQGQSRFGNQAYNESQTLEEQQAMLDTPSRAKIIPSAKQSQSIQATKNVSFDPLSVQVGSEEREDSPELEIPHSQPVVRPGSAPPVHKKVNTKVASLNRPQPNHERLPTRAPFSRSLIERQPEQVLPKPQKESVVDSFRASDCPTSSEDENLTVQSKPSTPPPETQLPTKRRREQDLDYEEEALRKMKYENLHSQAFDTDPNNVNLDVAFDPQGNTMTFLQRLNNLKKMSEEEQKIMFRNQGDNEWAQMGSWFIDRFQEDLKKLMDVRLERRKISMRFEDEIRRRQKDIEWHSASVERELKELKHGGGELIRGRDASSRRGTPQKK